MPTDPYVPTDPDARPRQQQNLPPGVAVPPAAGWRADRPGDGAADAGSLLGTPGPNVGYAYSLARRAAERFWLGLHESADDVVPVVAELAGRRAAAFGRGPTMTDVEHAAAILGYDRAADPEWARSRARLVHEAGHLYVRRRALVDAVPDALLLAPGAPSAGEIEALRAGLAPTGH